MSLFNEADTYLGKRLAYLRNKMEWPLKKLAEEMGVSIQQLQRYEHGENRISASALFKISKIFNVSMDSFFDQWVVKDDGALNILLVEDNPNDEFLFREAVNGITDKHHIYVVKNGGEAIQFEKKTATPLRFIPNIVFLDLNLPELHGFDVLQSFKKKHVWNDVPVVILTSSLNNVDIERAYQLNAASFIRKCFDFKTFQDQIRQTIQYWANVARLPQANIPPSIS